MSDALTEAYRAESKRKEKSAILSKELNMNFEEVDWYLYIYKNEKLAIEMIIKDKQLDLKL